MKAAVLIIAYLPGAALAGYIDHFATYDDIGVDKAPGHGTSHVLILPVVVEEAGLTPEATLLAHATTFYDNTASGFTFRNYFVTASIGRFDPVTTIGPTIRFASCPFTRDVNNNCTIARGDLAALGPAMATIRDILDAADPDVTFSDYDVNGATPNTPDGNIDGIVLLTNIEFGGIALPHYRICEDDIVGGLYCREPAFIGDLWDPTYDGVLVPWVAVAGARGGDADRATYVTVHEFGHLLGFADLYDESNNTTDLPYCFMGGWRYDNQPQLPDGFSRYVIGWGNPVQATGDGTVHLNPAVDSGDLLKLGAGNEYFLVENRRPRAPYDSDIVAPGVAIYHVKLNERPSADSRSFVTTITDCVQCEAWEPMVMLEQADGLFELQLDWDNRDDAGDLFHTGDIFPSAASGAPLSGSNHELSSNAYDGSSTGIAVTVVNHDNAGVAILNIAHPTVANACADLLCLGGTACESGVCVGGGTADGGPADGGVADDGNTLTDGGTADGSADGGASSDGALADGGSGDIGGDPAAGDPSPGDPFSAGDPITGDTASPEPYVPTQRQPESGCACDSRRTGVVSPFLLVVFFWRSMRRSARSMMSASRRSLEHDTPMVTPS